MRAFQHFIFWLGIGIFLVVAFAQGDGDYLKSFYFVTFLMPVAIGTASFFNEFLVPNFLLTRKYFQFGLYLTYTLIFSIYLELLVLTLAFIVLANYNYQNLNPYWTNLLLLTSSIYFFVFIYGFFLMIRKYQQQSHLIGELKDQNARNRKKHLVVRADRKNHSLPLNTIYYIESLSDYVKIHSDHSTIVTKEKISELEARLPENFVRIHRSFIVNWTHVSHYTREQLNINDTTLPISRTYRKQLVSHQKN